LRARLKKLRNPAQGARQKEIIGIQKSENLSRRSAKPFIQAIRSAPVSFEDDLRYPLSITPD
jgi:hypothetical protein